MLGVVYFRTVGFRVGGDSFLVVFFSLVEVCFVVLALVFEDRVI